MPAYFSDPISHVYEFTYIHPTYHNLFKSCYEQSLDTGPLCCSDRHYIALMAASRHRCLALMDYHSFMFERAGGDLNWLNGISHADHRLSLLDEMNKTLAHQPWMVKPEMIHKLLGRGSPDPVNTFSMTELNHAVAIMTQTQVLCSFVCAVGLERRTDLAPAEIDFIRCDDEDHLEKQRNKENKKENDSPVSVLHEPQAEVERLVKKMLELEQNRNKRARASVAGQSFDGEHQGNSDSDDESEAEGPATMPVYSVNPHYTYVDFQNRPDKTVRTYKIHEFTWEGHAYNLINELSHAMAERLDRKFDHIQRLTYNFMGSYKGEVDTSKYREAVWNYIQSLFGIKYDDYDYAKVNVLLDRSTKAFIKNAACYPYKLHDEFAQVMNGFKTSEKIHVVIMVMESRHQSQLLHFTRALWNYNAKVMSRSGFRRPLD